MKRKCKIATVLGVTFLTFGLYTWGIPAVVNIKSHKSSIEQTIKEKSGFIVDIGNPELSMGIFPSVWIKSDNISILNDDNSKALSIDNPQLKLKLLPLLRKKIEISRLSATKEEVNFVLTKDSKFLLGQYPIPKSNDKSEFTLSKMNLSLGEYNIKLDDKKNVQNVALQGKYFKHGKYVQNKHVEFATEGAFSVGNRLTDIFAEVSVDLPINKLSEDQFKLAAKISDFDIASISDYVNILTKGKIKSLNGIVNINANTEPDKFDHKKISTNIQTKNLVIVGKDKASSIIYNDKLSADFHFRTIENGIHIDEFLLESDKIHAKAAGKLFDLGHKAPKYNIEAEVSNTRLEDVVAILPGSPTLLQDFNLYKLKEHVAYGQGEGKVKFVGQGNRPNVTGWIKLRDMYLIRPLKGAPANAKVDMKFIGKRMLLDVFVPTGVKQNVEVKGNIKIDGSKYSELDIKSTDSINIGPAQEVLNPLHEILKFQLGPVPIMKISGLGNINMRSAGKKIDPHMWGTINFRNAAASFNEVHNLVLNNASGEVVFNDTQTTFRIFSGFINGKPVEIKGDCSVLGKLNVYVNAKGQDVKNLVKVINSSPILVDVQKVIKPFGNAQGVADVFLNIYGTAKNAEEVVFNEDLFSKGTITLHNAQTLMQDTFLPFTKVNGVVNFDQYDSDYDVTGYVRGSKLRVYGTGSNSIIDLKAHSDKFLLEDIFELLHEKMTLPYQREIGKIYASFDGGYKGVADADNIDYTKVRVDGKFIPNMESANPIRLNGGTFNIKNGVLKTPVLHGLFNGNPFTLSFAAKDIDKEVMSISGADFNFKNFDMSSINSIKNQIALPKEIASQIDNITDINGVVDIAGNIKNNNIYANTNLKDTSFVYKPLGAVVRVLNGHANMRGDVLYLDKINSRVSGMPVFLDGKISNALVNPNLNLSVSAKLTQAFFDRFYNVQSVYPMKMKGDINFVSRVKGTFDALSAKSTLNLAENASIYYMGATLAGAPSGTVSSEGIVTNPVSIITDVVLYPNKIKLNSMDYNQIITSQNKKKSVQKQLNMSGEVALLKDNLLGFKNFRIKTLQPTNARVFNVLFKKPTIKQGVFTTDMLINGTSDAPYVLGFLNVKSIDIPLLDSTIRDVNLDFKDDYIYLNSKGVVLTNDVDISAKILNKPVKPIVVDDINVQMDELNLNVITQALSDLEADSTRSGSQTDVAALIEPNALVINNAQVNADRIIIKKADATNFKSHIVLNQDGILKIDNYEFNLANGTVKGDIGYDLNKSSGSASMKIEGADAQIISENFFDMPGQMYGFITGDMKVACSGLTSVDCVNSLSGEGSFEVSEGRMPKLGSLEYLLKAGNLITGGVTGLSINGIIDLITPLKTGNFTKIRGDVHVENGVANDINVYSYGQDLNMYMTGSYNIATLVADMEVYGSLSKNFSTLLGKIGNSSLNTLFNTIPGININEINPKSTSNINKIPNFNKSNTLRV
ncbi:MAG: AsmA-like C-terminal region-containing protein, partial [Muribaculaceae bacterium]|nr:AsmA-like C-terminal region-containing protein [Muribaculaceae bacterium]